MNLDPPVVTMDEARALYTSGGSMLSIYPTDKIARAFFWGFTKGMEKGDMPIKRCYQSGMTIEFENGSRSQFMGAEDPCQMLGMRFDLIVVWSAFTTELASVVYPAVVSVRGLVRKGPIEL